MWQYELITDHNGCWHDNKRIGQIGTPIDYLSDVQDICITGNAICLNEGLEACDKTAFCEAFSIYSGVAWRVNMYNATAFNTSNPCPGTYGLSHNPSWNIYKKISYGKKGFKMKFRLPLLII